MHTPGTTFTFNPSKPFTQKHATDLDKHKVAVALSDLDGSPATITGDMKPLSRTETFVGRYIVKNKHITQVTVQ